MRAISVLPFVLAAACGSVHDRSECSASADCPVGSYCARTGDGNVCWPDAVAPAVSGVSVACDHAPCLRSGVLHVEATIADDAELLGADVSLSLGGPAVPMARSGTLWSADVPLARYPFDAFEAEVVATVTARDGARNTASAGASPIAVTRLQWTKLIDPAVGFQPTAPAVMSDGTVVLGGSTGNLYFVAPDGTDAHPPEPVASGQITAAPAVGERAIWVGSEDFSLYAVNLDGSGLITNVGVNSEGPIKGSIAVLSQSMKEWGFASSGSGRVVAASTTPFEYARSTSTNTFTVGPVVRADGKICAATATATLRCYSFDGGAFAEDFNVSVGVNVSAPLALDDAGKVWTGSQDAKLNATTTAGITTTVATLPGSVIDSPVVLSGGDIVVGDQSGILHRFTSEGAQMWPTEPNLGGPVLSPMVLAGTAATLIVPTKGGKIHALRGDGSTIWSVTIDGAPELRTANIYTPPGQPADSVLSVAYFAGSNGKLHAVIVDGKLDGNAPWPKAFHDPRNTNRAGAQP